MGPLHSISVYHLYPAVKTAFMTVPSRSIMAFFSLAWLQTTMGEIFYSVRSNQLFCLPVICNSSHSSVYVSCQETTLPVRHGYSLKTE